jgi:hypothetical protein
MGTIKLLYGGDMKRRILVFFSVALRGIQSFYKYMCVLTACKVFSLKVPVFAHLQSKKIDLILIIKAETLKVHLAAREKSITAGYHKCRQFAFSWLFK